MPINTLLKLLDNIEAGKPVNTEDLPVFRTVFDAMAAHPEETRRYLHERATTRFQRREDISDHTKRFAAILGLPVSQVTNATQQLGAHSRRTQESLDREQATAATHQDRLTKLKAAVDVIQGYGSTPQVADDYGIAPKVLYNHVNKHLADNGLDLTDLKAISTPKRKALGNRVLRAGEAELATYLRNRIKGDGPYRKSPLK